MARCAPSDEVCYIGCVFAPILLVLFASVCVARHFLGPMQGLFRILVFAQEIYALYDHQTVHTRASKRARRDDKSSALVSQTSTSAKSFGHQQPPSQQQLIPPVCYVNMCYVIVVLHIHCFLAHSVCGTVSGSRYSCPKQCICPVFTAIEATFGSAGNPAAGTTGVLHEYECATYIVCYIVPFLTPFVVSLRSLMNIAGEATMNQLLWNRRRALQRNLLGTSELPKLQSRPCKIVNNPLRLRRQHTQHTIT